MPPELTDKQREVLDFIARYIAKHEVPPKLREIAEGIGIASRGVAHRYVQALVDAGYVDRNLSELSEDEDLTRYIL